MTPDYPPPPPPSLGFGDPAFFDQGGRSAAAGPGPTLSFLAAGALRTVGENIRTARLRRGESETLAAERAGVSRQTWRRLEKGHPAVSVGLLFEAMAVYGFGDQLFALADPALDAEGIARDAARRPLRGRAADRRR